jgi:hypothetical protein
MSLEIFKQNMLSYMQNPKGISSYGDFAKKLTMEYDMAVKRGFDTVNNIPIAKGNTELMESTLNGILNTALQQSSGEHPIITNLGPAFIAYWTGATMSSVPPPLIPSPGAVVNVATVSSFITDPGIWTPTDTLVKTPPKPKTPPTPLPMMATQTNDVEPAQKMTKEDIAAAEEDIKIAEKEIVQLKAQGAIEYADDTEYDPDYPPVGISAQLQAAKEIISYQKQRIASGEKESTNYDDAVDASIASKEIGERIVAYAKRDIGQMESPLPPNQRPANWGPYVKSVLNGVGINSPAFWCAAFVSKHYRLAGAKSPNSAGCSFWSAWARKNKLYSNKPVIGAAVLYGGRGSEHHIGIVSSIIDANTITTIEGNTSGGGFDRNGVGVFQKKVKVSRCSGFVLPVAK